MLLQHFYSFFQFFLCHALGSAQHDGSGMLHLVIEEFTEVLHVHLTLLAVYHHQRVVDMNLHMTGYILYSLHDVRKLADTRRLDQDSIRCIGVNHFLQGCSEVSHQGAADAAGVHLIDLYACLLQKTAVDADLTELVLNEDELLALEYLLQKLLNQCRLSGA